MPARLRLLAVLTACSLLVALPAVADGGTAALSVPPAPQGTSAARSAAQPALGHARNHPLAPANAAVTPGVAPDAAGVNRESGASTSDALSPASSSAPSPAASAAPQAGSGAPQGQSSTSGTTAGNKAGKQSKQSAKKTAKKTARTTGKKSARKAARKPAKKVATKATPNRASTAKVAARTSPGFVTTGHYVRSLRGGGHDVGSMRALGMRDAARNASGAQHLVLMDIGGQVNNGVHLSTTRHFVSYRGLVSAMNAYVDGYHARMHSNAPVTIAIGTNNDLRVDTGAGIAWARQVVNPIRSHAAGYAQITIAGANDIEPGFRASPAETRAWLHGYLASTTALFVFNGSADGCSSTRRVSRCNSGWTSRDVLGFAGTIAPTRTIALPQIYNNAMVGQWAQLASGATISHHRLRVVGTLTENLACGRDPYCPTMPSWQAYRHLYAALRRINLAPADMPYQVDLDVQ